MGIFWIYIIYLDIFQRYFYIFIYILDIKYFNNNYLYYF